MQQPQRSLRRRRRKKKYGWAALPVLLVLLLLYPFYEATQFQIDEHTVSVNGLPNQLKNVELAFASDFHYQGELNGSMTEKIVTRLNHLTADIILLGGDYADSTEGAIAFFQDIPAFSSRKGVYAVLGDKEYTNPEKLPELLSVMKSKGVVPLVNETECIAFGQSKLYIVGLDDATMGKPQPELLSASLSESDTVIVLAHHPKTITAIQNASTAAKSTHWYDLVLFGHTHGGQINLFGWSPFEELRLDSSLARYWKGWHEENHATVLTSTGVGTEVWPIRFCAMPQIHLITLKPQ